MSTAPRDDTTRLGSEAANPAVGDLARLTTLDLVSAMQAEDEVMLAAVAAVSAKVAEVVDETARRLAGSGRLHYFGAGTSGRLGVLDAAECPPTFGVDADLVQGHMAGGDSALTVAVEGAEDDRELGRRDVERADITGEDVVVGLAASGRTPYVLSVLEAAKARGAFVVAITVNRDTPCHRLADVTIDPSVGPEVLAGSSRLKAGTAQKLILNRISTAVMVRLGRTYGNLMVGVVPTNEKLRARARHLVETITGRRDGSTEALEAAGGDVRVACVMLACGLPVDEARQRLQRAGGHLGEVLPR